MKISKIIMFLIIGFFSVLTFADVSVDGYYRKDGTYVPPHHRSDPNSTSNDNWSTKGNTNPYTGQQGKKNSDNIWQNNR